jgi:FHS family L-fucose permease-like MFS transporter
MSVMFPTIFALGIKGLGDDAKIGGSLIVMAILGGAVFPPLQGWIGKANGTLALGYVLPALSYIVVVLYGFIVPRFTTQNVSQRSVVITPQNN